jgi:hypothetical protein
MLIREEPYRHLHYSHDCFELHARGDSVLAHHLRNGDAPRPARLHPAGRHTSNRRRLSASFGVVRWSDDCWTSCLRMACTSTVWYQLLMMRSIGVRDWGTPTAPAFGDC